LAFEGSYPGSESMNPVGDEKTGVAKLVALRFSV
jgi:hypothetical protein